MGLDGAERFVAVAHRAGAGVCGAVSDERTGADTDVVGDRGARAVG